MDITNSTPESDSLVAAEGANVQLDDVLKKFKFCGLYHCYTMVFIFFAYMMNIIHTIHFVFAVEETKYRCKDPDFNTSTCGSFDSSMCMEWEYENPNSFVAEIPCQDWKRTLVGTAHSLGYMGGLLIVGPLSDRFGRKKAIVLTGVLGGIMGLAKSFTSSYWVYILLAFLESAIGDTCSPVYVLNVEIVTTKYRVPYYILCAFGYIFGGTVLPFIAWAVPYWRTLLRVVYAPALLFFFYNFILDESPRWLLTKGKKDKAIAIIQKAADINKLKIDDIDLRNLICEDEKEVEFISTMKLTFSSKTLMKRCLVCIMWWTTSTFVYYGMSINSVSLQGNKYINFALICVIDIPGYLSVMYVLMNCKRKYPLIATFFAGSILCFIQPFLPSNLSWLSILLYMLGKVMSSFYFNITYVFTSELFPTYTRNSLHALCSSMGRIGSILAPQTPLLAMYWSGLPSMVFGGAALLAGLATFLVPDTAEYCLPDTVRQAKEQGKSKTDHTSYIALAEVQKNKSQS